MGNGWIIHYTARDIKSYYPSFFNKNAWFSLFFFSDANKKTCQNWITAYTRMKKFHFPGFILKFLFFPNNIQFRRPLAWDQAPQWGIRAKRAERETGGGKGPPPFSRSARFARRMFFRLAPLRRPGPRLGGNRLWMSQAPSKPIPHLAEHINIYQESSF